MSIAKRAVSPDRRKVPLYRLIEAVLRDQIWSGELAAGDRIPTEEELSRTYEVSRPTVRQALQILEQDDLIYREAGRGTFVNAIVEELSAERRHLRLSELVDLDGPADIRIQRTGTLAARGQVREALDVQFGEEIFYFVRIYWVDGKPLGGGKVHVPLETGRSLTKKDMTAARFLKRLSERDGARLGDVDFSLDAVLADARTGAIFETRPGAPMISVRRTSYAADGAPLEYSHMLFRSDLCRLRFRQRPDRGGGWATVEAAR